MKAMILSKHGKPSILRIVSIPEPEPDLDEVKISIKTIGINYAEILSRKGLYGWAPKLPYIPGMEAYGIVEKTGKHATRYKTGDKVIVGTQYGCYAEKIVVKEKSLFPAIDFYSESQNAAFAVNFMTAWISLFKMAHLQENTSLLIHAASSGVGTAAIKIAKSYGCEIYGTAGSDEKIKLIQELGVDLAINYHKQEFVAAIKQATNNEGVDVVLEMVGGDVYKNSLKILKPFGRIVVTGFASLDLKKWNPLSWYKTWKDIPRTNIRDMAHKSYGVMASHLGYLLNQEELIQRNWQDLVSFITKHNIYPLIGNTFAFDEIPQAHELIEKRKSIGKNVILVK